MQDICSLEKEQSLINEYIERMGFNHDIEPIFDGIINIKDYIDSNCKIAWVLKEPYDDFDEKGNPFGGGWSFVDLFNSNENIYEIIKGNNTFYTIAYTSYCIQKKCNYSSVDWIYDNPEIANILRSIAYINTSKFPGFSSSEWSKLYNSYEYWRPILLFQLKVYQPQVVIFGNTMGLYENDLGISDMKIYDEKRNLEYAIKDKTLYINAYHPSQRTIVREEYIDSIVSLIEENKYSFL